MLKLRQRGDTYHVDSGEDNQKARVQASLATKNRDMALRIIHRLELAISEGPKSSIWPEFERTVPPETYIKFATKHGVQAKAELLWAELLEMYRQQMERKREAAKMAAATVARYDLALNEFTTYLEQEQVTAISEISPMMVERFKGWRTDRLKAAKNYRNGGALDLDMVIIKGVFLWGAKHEVFAGKNPVVIDKRPGKSAENGAAPYAAKELQAIRAGVGKDLLVYLAFRWTGLRRGDIADLRWREIHFDRKELEKVTNKRKKTVYIPLHGEFLKALKKEHKRRKPVPHDFVLLNQAGKPYSGARLYQRVLDWGKRAKVVRAHPHRFRDTFAVDILLRGGTISDVAKALGDTSEIIEKHYSPCVPELRDRLRSIMTKGNGLGN